MSLIGSVWDSVGGLLMGAGFSYLASQLSNIVRIDYPMTCNFAVEVDGIVDSGFVSCDGLSDRATPYEINQCNDPVVRKIHPYQRQIGLVTLEQGFSFQGGLEEWYYEVSEYIKGSKSPTRDVSILQMWRVPTSVPLLGGQLVEVRRWNLWNCVCVDLTFPSYDANSEAEISYLKCVLQAERYDRPTTFGQVGMVIDMLKG